MKSFFQVDKNEYLAACACIVCIIIILYITTICVCVCMQNTKFKCYSCSSFIYQSQLVLPSAQLVSKSRNSPFPYKESKVLHTFLTHGEETRQQQHRLVYTSQLIISFFPIFFSEHYTTHLFLSYMQVTIGSSTKPMNSSCQTTSTIFVFISMILNRLPGLHNTLALTRIL